MKLPLNRVAIRGAMIAGIAFCAPWFALHGQSAAVSRDTTVQPPSFRIGETLNYRIDWQRYTGAGVAQLQVVDRGKFYGASSWHFRATVHSAQPIRALYPMDDQIDSYAFFTDLVSRQYQEHFREFGKPEDTDASLVSPGELSSATAPRVIVPPNTRDVLSAIYLLRVTDWHGAQELRVPVFDGENVYEMIAKAGPSSTVQLSQGNYQATEIEIHLFDGSREVPDEHFKIWLADDAARTPLLCEAHLSIGVVRIELTSDTASIAESGAKSSIPLARSSHPAGN
jgi:hypothetical protein